MVICGEGTSVIISYVNCGAYRSLPASNHLRKSPTYGKLRVTEKSTKHRGSIHVQYMDCKEWRLLPPFLLILLSTCDTCTRVSQWQSLLFYSSDRCRYNTVGIKIETRSLLSLFYLTANVSVQLMNRLFDF